METATTLSFLWFVGFAFSVAMYLVLIAWPEQRKHASAGIIVAMFHIGSRILLLGVFWPLFIVLCAIVWIMVRRHPDASPESGRSARGKIATLLDESGVSKV